MKVYGVATDPPYHDHNPDHRQRDRCYLAYLSEDDVIRLEAEISGRISLWAPGIVTVDDLIAVVKEHDI